MDDDTQIDPELWLNFLMMYMGDEEQKQELIAGMVDQTGLTEEKVEECLRLMTEVLIEETRSN